MTEQLPPDVVDSQTSRPRSTSRLLRGGAAALAGGALVVAGLSALETRSVADAARGTTSTRAEAQRAGNPRTAGQSAAAQEANPNAKPSGTASPAPRERKPNAGAKRGVHGTVASVSGSTVRVTRPNGETVDLKTTSATKVLRAAAGTVGDIAVGDHVGVAGVVESATLRARHVIDHGDTAPAGERASKSTTTTKQDGQSRTREHVRGVVTAVGNGTFTVKVADGSTRAVTTDAQTAVVVVRSITVAQLAAGERVHAAVTRAADGSLTATAIRAGAPGKPGAGPGHGRGPGKGSGRHGAKDEQRASTTSA